MYLRLCMFVDLWVLVRQGGLWEICESFLSLWLTNDYDDGNDVESDEVNVWVFVRVCVCVCVCVCESRRQHHNNYFES